MPLGSETSSDSPSLTAVPDQGRASLAQQLRTQRAKVEALQGRLKPDHPDLAHEKRVLADLESRVSTEGAVNASIGSTGAGPGAKGSTTGERIAAWQKEIDQLQTKQEQRKVDDERLKKQLSSYNARLEAAPQLETEMTDMMRDYGIIRDQYNSLLSKSEESKIAANLERRQIGEQFRIIESARLPVRPSSPDRVRLNMFGFMGGLGFGLLIVALLEYRDTKFRTDDDIIMSLALPVLAVIPAMITTKERQRAHRRRLVLGICTSVGMVAGVAALVVWQWQSLRAWIR